MKGITEHASAHDWERVGGRFEMRCTRCLFVWEPHMSDRDLPKTCKAKESLS